MMLLSGAVSLILGVMLIVMPSAGAVAFLWLIGSYSIIFGVLLVALAFRLRGMGNHFKTTAHV